MHNSKLIRLLKTLEPGECKDFPKFLQSPFFNSNKQCLTLCNYLIKYYPDFDSPKLGKELVFQKIFPGKPYNYNTLSNLMSSLANLTEEYLLNLQFQKEGFEKKKMLTKALGERKGSYELFEKNTEALINEVENREVRDIDYYLQLRSLNHDLYYHPITNRQASGISGIKKAMDNLDLFYAQTKLLYSLELKARAYLFGENPPVILENELVVESEDILAAKSPVCSIYLKILKLYDFVYDKNIFDEAKSLLSEHIKTIGKVERAVIILHLLNYCIRLINKGKSIFFSEAFELYKMGLQFEAFIEQNRLSEVLFSNIVSVGTRCGEFAWVKNFIHEYKHFLEEEERDSATLLSLAFLAFNEGKFSQAIDLLLNHNFEKPLNSIKSKTILLRTYFELFVRDDSYYELLLAQTLSFEKHIRRNKNISAEKADGFLNFIKLTRRVANGLLENHIPEDLIDAIESHVSLPYKEWLLQKAGKLESQEERVFH
jgi:hypothetical protein